MMKLNISKLIPAMTLLAYFFFFASYASADGPIHYCGSTADKAHQYELQLLYNGKFNTPLGQVFGVLFYRGRYGKLSFTLSGAGIRQERYESIYLDLHGTALSAKNRDQVGLHIIEGQMLLEYNPKNYMRLDPEKSRLILRLRNITTGNIKENIIDFNFSVKYCF